MIDIPDDIDLANAEFLQVWDLLRHTQRSIFLTGKAGTGKSTFLRYICQNIKKNYVVLAPTGIAAVNVGGVTLHSFFQIPLRPIPPDDPDYSKRNIRRKLHFTKEKVQIIQKIDLIIIDEISMVRPDIIDFIDRVLRCYTRNTRDPFGGKQLLMVGDVFQLEPVVSSDTRDILARYYPGNFFFNAKAYDEAELISIELKKVYRQNDKVFIDILDHVRTNSASLTDLNILNSRYKASQTTDPDEFSITLASRRDIVDSINSCRMNEIPSKEYIYNGIIDGEFPEKILPTDLNLVLKEFAQVILIKNDKEKRWVNGTLAKVIGLSDSSLTIELESGAIYSIEREIWNNVKYTYDSENHRIKEEVAGQFIQFPVKAAWALTIHKSQGLTFNNVTIDMGNGAFGAGQSYVALSRCRSLSGLRLASPLTKKDIIVSPEAVRFSQKFNDLSAMKSALAEAHADILLADASNDFDNMRFSEAVKKISESFSLRNKFHDPVIQRFISMKLGVIRRQRAHMEQMQETLSGLAAEFVQLGMECLEGNEPQAALANFRKARKLAPDNPDAIYGESCALCDLNQNLEAIQIAEILRDVGGRKYNYASYAITGQAYSSLEEYDLALNYLLRALRIRRTDPHLHRKLADIYEKLDFTAKADEHRGIAQRIESRKNRKGKHKQ